MIGTGMHATTGTPLADIEHIRQSIGKILTTPIGSRVMRRQFGSLLPELIDAPINARTRLQCMAASATAIIRWESRVRPAKVTLQTGTTLETAASLVIELTATLRGGHRAGEAVNLIVPVKV